MDLLHEAERAPFVGWDFSWLGNRLVTSSLPWDFTATVRDALGASSCALDMETGGGERLASMPRRPDCVVATEPWPPNVQVAAERLGPLGVFVVQDEGALDNVAQDESRSRGRLPFRGGAFDLVVNRHGAYWPAEIARVLRRDGVFMTQQADSASRQFHELLGLVAPVECPFDLNFAVWQLERAGLRIEAAEEGEEVLRFADVGALAWYLKAIPWCVPDFSIERYRGPLLRLRGRDLVVRQARFWLQCRK